MTKSGPHPFPSSLLLLLLMAVIAAQHCRALLAFASVLLLLLLLRNSLSAEAQNLSFSIQLTHRDSPSSPLFNASQTPSDRLTNALLRSANRVKRFKEAAAFSPLDTSLTGDGEYLMNLSLGTPPVPMLGSLDTGSGLVWTQCEPCALCYDQSTPFFNPKTSSTYQNVTCDSEACLSLREKAHCESSSCHYRYIYAYGASTAGVMATETVTLGSTTSGHQPFSLELEFGCGTYNEGNFGATGIVGFGQGPLSFPSQVKDLIDHKFSYCLTPFSSNHPSRLYFGRDSEVSGAAVHSTPIVSGEVDTFYYITLESISVESDKILLTSKSSSSLRMQVDSANSFTYLPYEMYDSVVSNLMKLIPSEPVTTDPDLCYKPDVRMPKIVMHFAGGANVKLSDLNSFVKTSFDDQDVVCFAFLVGDDQPVYGNIQQANFLISYDLKGKNLSFRKADCTKY